MPSNAGAWKSADGDGESLGRREGKRAQFGLGSGGELRKPRRGNANRPRAERRTKELRGGDESCQSRVLLDLGSCVKWQATGTRRRHRRPACVGNLRLAIVDRAAGMRNRTKRREHSDRNVPAFDSGQESKAQSIDRITQREGAYPCWADPFGEQRSILCGRSRVWDEPSRFLGRETLEKPETVLSIVEQPSGWKGSGACSPRSLTPMRLRCDNNATGPSFAKAPG